jgi:hypothetical protein
MCRKKRIYKSSVLSPPNCAVDSVGPKLISQPPFSLIPAPTFTLGLASPRRATRLGCTVGGFSDHATLAAEEGAYDADDEDDEYDGDSRGRAAHRKKALEQLEGAAVREFSLDHFLDFAEEFVGAAVAEPWRFPSIMNPESAAAHLQVLRQNRQQQLYHYHHSLQQQYHQHQHEQEPLRENQEPENRQCLVWWVRMGRAIRRLVAWLRSRRVGSRRQ